MKEWKTTVAFFVCMFSPFFLMYAYSAFSGSAANTLDLVVFGPSATFSCQWVSPEADQAVFETAGGSRKLVNLGQRDARAEVGKKYRLETKFLHRFAQRTYLVRA